ncbi:MAG TPA: dihydrodipicolinate synthase family protein [Anaerovoracaceae bacterium]|nr:dihydrodipicolinate synthase family protein [Anaerovoracaceae bacterium]
MSAKEMKNGFYPALGTPTDNDGKIIGISYEKGIELMISSGAAGVLCMGSMGNMAGIRNSEYAKTASLCVKVVAKRVPVMVGVMDCSVNRVLDRIESLDNIEIDGVVATAPYYYKLNAGEIVSFYTMVSEKSKYPLYIYDLPSVTQSPVTKDILTPLMKIHNIKGMKTANINLILDLLRNNSIRDDFSIFYSGLDSFDTAIKSGIRKNLDGMFTCTPYSSKMMYENFENGDGAKISKHLNNILILRNTMLKEDIFPAYSYAMELLGCAGNYHPDYNNQVSDKLKEEIYECMKTIKEI